MSLVSDVAQIVLFAIGMSIVAHFGTRWQGAFGVILVIVAIGLLARQSRIEGREEGRFDALLEAQDRTWDRT